jgi:hypothetical protein
VRGWCFFAKGEAALTASAQPRGAAVNNPRGRLDLLNLGRVPHNRFVVATPFVPYGSPQMSEEVPGIGSIC